MNRGMSSCLTAPLCIFSEHPDSFFFKQILIFIEFTSSLLVSDISDVIGTHYIIPKRDLGAIGVYRRLVLAQNAGKLR